MTGAMGATESTVKVSVAGWLGLPKLSVATASMVCEPSFSGVVGVQDQLPEALVVALQRNVPSVSLTVTVVPARAVPVMSGVLSEVMEPLAGVVMTGCGTMATSIFVGPLPLGLREGVLTGSMPSMPPASMMAWFSTLPTVVGLTFIWKE